jgi:hypothetical protein
MTLVPYSKHIALEKVSGCRMNVCCLLLAEDCNYWQIDLAFNAILNTVEGLVHALAALRAALINPYTIAAEPGGKKDIQIILPVQVCQRRAFIPLEIEFLAAGRELAVPIIEPQRIGQGEDCAVGHVSPFR